MLKTVRLIMDHRRLVVAFWIVAALGIFAVSLAVGSRTVNNFSLPGTGSQDAVNLLQAKFPAQAGDEDQIVFHALTGKLTSSAADKATITSTVDRVSRLPHVTGVISPYATGGRAISRDGTTAFATVQFNETASALPTAAVDKVINTAESARSPSLEVQLGGQAIQNVERPTLGSATAVGIVAAVVILLIAFGSLVAMSLPIITALVGLAGALGLIGLLSHVINMDQYASSIALMIGLGVGVDYSLFIVTRFREAYHANGGDVPKAVEAAVNTAGRAVLFAGITVVIALLGMFVLGISLLNGIAVAAVIGVLCVLASAQTLLPALLRMTGKRVAEGGSRKRRRQPAASAGVPAEPRFWLGWVRRVQRHPGLTGIATVAVMLALASPALGLRLGISDAGNNPTSDTTRQAYDLLSKGFGPGLNGPLQIAVALPTANDTAAVNQLTDALKTTPGIVAVAPARIGPNGTAASIVAYPAAAPQSAQTSNLVNHLRDSVLPPIEHFTGATAYVGGATATQVDFVHVLDRKLPEFLAIVIALGALLLMVVFRSLLIPLTAAAMNLLTIGASVGIAQAVFQRGWGASLLGVKAGPVDAFIPVVAFAVIFGLATDYEVFLVSRIHEKYQQLGDASAAITEGFAHTARVVCAAAAVMTCVFLAFLLGGQRPLAEFGLELGVGVALDALVIRLLLLPAVLQLLGTSAWMMPRRLGRLLPRVAIEAEGEPAPIARSTPPALKASS